MKKLFLTTVVFSVLFIIGCQENSITDPIGDIDQKEVNKSDDPSVHQGTITLEGMLEIPNQSNSYLRIIGQIGYVHRIVLVDPIPPAHQQYVSLRLNVNADLDDPSSPTDPTWTITSDSEDIFYVSEEGIYLLEKTYTIQGREDGMVLVCRFLVTTDGVGLNEMWLAVREGNSTVNNLNKNVEHEPVTDPLVHITEFD